MSVDDNKGSIRYLFVFYSIPIRPNVKIDKHEGIKKVRETSDMVMGLPTENTKDTKTRMHMKLDDKSQQITQITQIIIEKIKSSNETNETNKRNRRIRRNAQKYIMVQEKDKKKFLCLSALSAVKKNKFVVET